MLEVRKRGSTGDRELNGKVDWIIVPNSFLPSLIKLYTLALCHGKPSLLASSTEVGFGNMNFLNNDLREKVKHHF